MTPEERANEVFNGFAGGTKQGLIELFVYHIKESILEEREACARIADNSSKKGTAAMSVALDIAQAIRARGEEEK